MTTVFIKSKRAQPLFLSGLLPPPPNIYSNLEVEIDEEIDVEIVEDIEVQVCRED